jgi:hypothetical protein
VGGYRRIIAQKPDLWKAQNVANDSGAVLLGTSC